VQGKKVTTRKMMASAPQMLPPGLMLSEEASDQWAAHLYNYHYESWMRNYFAEAAAAHAHAHATATVTTAAAAVSRPPPGMSPFPVGLPALVPLPAPLQVPMLHQGYASPVDDALEKPEPQRKGRGKAPIGGKPTGQMLLPKELDGGKFVPQLPAPWGPEISPTGVPYEDASKAAPDAFYPYGESGFLASLGGGRFADPEGLGADFFVPAEWSKVTTVMMRHIPNKYTQRMLVEEVNRAGFLGAWDFLYLPIDLETVANKGYAFLNFVDPRFAWMFCKTFEGRQMNRFDSSKVISVTIATLQGFEANYSHYAFARVSRGNPSARPIFRRTNEEMKKIVKKSGAAGEKLGPATRGGERKKKISGLTPKGGNPGTPTTATKKQAKKDNKGAVLSLESALGVEASEEQKPIQEEKNVVSDDALTLGGDAKDPDKERPRQISDASTVAPPENEP